MTFNIEIDFYNNVCFIKNHSKQNSNTLLNLLRIFVKQTLSDKQTILCAIIDTCSEFFTLTFDLQEQSFSCCATMTTFLVFQL